VGPVIIGLGMPRGGRVGQILREINGGELTYTYSWEGDNLYGFAYETERGAEIVDLVLGDDLPMCEAEMVRIVLHERYPFLEMVEVERRHCVNPHPLIPGSQTWTYVRFYRKDASDY
jgi:hypothetical protein